eukprot:TRINITY_DN205_c0_g1_i1.p1 TRINITY_DN205_c0_g1~~TRINITY_DN205_c0_g1_i1.p1  ORF type:complete len:162 (-),score=66.80 TRINITY_DN205_c0_g1_i1:123-608(-)
MLVPKKDRLTVYRYLMKEGVLCVELDFFLPKHPGTGVKNLYVINLLRSLESRELVRGVKNWAHKYYFLTETGCDYLREYLHLDADVQPDTKKAPARAAGGERGERRGGDRERGDRRGGDRDRRDFGRGKKEAGAPSGSWRPSYAEGAGRGRGGRSDYRKEQ